ncbi:DUF1360 domain-containing protein [Bacillus aerolatus]|uniref:DUF1360 domain-containing protein n=2 Tax=Bacillus aerolatus TaxID=2653354 RepID=A0A6I1FCN0_9BACI|nr:DUF1360 domain-containing protein [Bacillus aerolatus]
MNITVIDFIILFLSSFRLTRLLVFDEIMEKIREPFFTEIEEVSAKGEVEIFLVPKPHGWKGWIGRMLNCYWCTGMWASAFCCLLYMFLPGIGGMLLLILAIAGGAAILELAVQQFINHSD